MVKKIGFVIVFIFLISCKREYSNSRISAKIVESCSSLSNCRIKFSDIITDEWDYVLITNEQISLEDLDNILGFEYPYFSDIGSRIIFVKNNTVVYHEDEFPQAENVLKRTLRFNLKNNYLKLKKEQAVFDVVENGNYIELR